MVCKMSEKKALKNIQKKLKKHSGKKARTSSETAIVDILSLLDKTPQLKQLNKKSNQINNPKKYDDTYHLDISDLSAFYRPYKSKACSKCPALKRGLCKCALKKIKKIA